MRAAAQLWDRVGKVTCPTFCTSKIVSVAQSLSGPLFLYQIQS
jgi:hypothetical protein